MATMDFVAATKDGLIVYDALSLEKDWGEDGGWRDWSKGQGTEATLKVVASLPSAPNAFGHAWSPDGALLGSVTDAGAAIYDARNRYKQILEMERIAPDVGGRTGGVRNLYFSPNNSFVVTYEKWDPQFPDNVHIWDLREEQAGKRLHSCCLKHYTSGALPMQVVKWTSDESLCLVYVPGQGVLVLKGDLSDAGDESVKTIPEENIVNFELCPGSTGESCYIAFSVPEKDSIVAKATLWSIGDAKKPVFSLPTATKVKDIGLKWNAEGNALLILANSDVDETGNSYFGTTHLWFAKVDGKSKPLKICGAEEGLVQDLSWNPAKNEFATIVGSFPAKVALYDGKTGKLTSTLGTTKRNTLRWNSFGRFLAVGGFGTLPGDLDFFDRSCEETVSSLRAALTVNCDWAPDGRQFLTSTVAPRMNEGNQITIFRYTGETLIRIDYAPEKVEARHEDTGAGARTKTQALLYAASWRPDKDTYSDTPATPRPAGAAKRKKGLPEGQVAEVTATKAWAPRGPSGDSGGSLVAAMMRGEVGLPETAAPAGGRGGPGWDTEVAKPLEEWEIRKLEKERKKEAEKKEAEEKAAQKQKVAGIEQAEKDGKRRLKEIKQKLEELEALKDKEWDELTEEDEAELEGELDLRAELKELEKKFGTA
jgi:translation initiation factor 2A